jgi:PHD/YefM family antitoxin component YafN of YafNO toxin-antitoxin module
MREVTAAQLRQAMGKVARGLARTGEPVLLKFGTKPVGVIVSLKDFEERFTLNEAAERRRELMREILGDRIKSKKRVDAALGDLRER